MYGKLVRDNIPNIIESNGEKPIVEVLDEQNYKIELENKLIEECSEVINSSGKDRIEELADLLEVMIAIVDLENKTIDDVENARIKKKEKRGSFSKRLYLKDVER